MDYIRRCYTAKMIVYQGQPPIDVEWYRAAKGAKTYPTPHVFGSASTWRRGEPVAPIGEVAVGEYRRGANSWGTLGQAPCGPADAFEAGGVVGVDPPLELLPNGVAKCCKTARVARGGAKVGGRARIGLDALQKGKGGARNGGRAPQGSKNKQIGSGGARTGGIAWQLVRVFQPGSGGARGGGAALQNQRLLQLASGGALAGGTADQWDYVTVPGSGAGIMNAAMSASGTASVGNTIAASGAAVVAPVITGARAGGPVITGGAAAGLAPVITGAGSV